MPLNAALASSRLIPSPFCSSKRYVAPNQAIWFCLKFTVNLNPASFEEPGPNTAAHSEVQPHS
jgi:hypothetical protein